MGAESTWITLSCRKERSRAFALEKGNENAECHQWYVPAGPQKEPAWVRVEQSPFFSLRGQTGICQRHQERKLWPLFSYVPLLPQARDGSFLGKCLGVRQGRVVQLPIETWRNE